MSACSWPKTGVDLVGNVAPIDEIGSLAPPTQPSQFQLPNGEICKWQLDPFDFESNFPYEDAVFDLVTAFEVIEHVVGSPRQICQGNQKGAEAWRPFFSGYSERQ